MNEENHKEIMYKLGELSEGMRGVHIRLDKINGTVQRHEEEIFTLKLTKSYVSGVSKVVSLIIGAVGGLIAILIPYIIALIVPRFTQ